MRRSYFEVFHKLAKQLTNLYPEREARTIARLIFEEVFQYPTPGSKQTWDLSLEPQLAQITTRLLNAEPWQYIVGEADFYGLKFQVDKTVLIPRPETEELVHWIIQSHSPKQSTRILDVGTGSGCIAVTLAKFLPEAKVYACDISTAALNLAQKNAAKNQVNVAFFQLDILDERTWNTPPITNFHIIVSNPPYITSAERPKMGKNVWQHEPHLALFVPNDDPLQFYIAISQFASQKLLPKAQLFFELNEAYAHETVQVMKQSQFQAITTKTDFFGKNRMLRGTQRPNTRLGM